MRKASPVTLICTAALVLACANALATTVYKWVDEKGVTHYSDQPHPDSQKVEVKSAQSFPNTGTRGTQPAQPAAPPPGSPYTVCEIAAPENDEVFMNTDTVNARLRTEPALRPGDRVIVSLDGLRMSKEGAAAMEFTMSPVPRGTHSVTATIISQEGETVCTTPGRTFHVRQPSRQAPNPANRPRF